MEPTLYVLLAAVLGYGVYWLLRRRARLETDRQARADKRAKLARDDAKAIQRTLDGRR